MALYELMLFALRAAISNQAAKNGTRRPTATNPMANSKENADKTRIGHEKCPLGITLGMMYLLDSTKKSANVQGKGGKKNRNQSRFFFSALS